MGSYALPALDIKPPQQQPNQLEQLGQLLQAKNMIAEQPVRQQILQQQAQSGSLQLQQEQQAQKDQQAFRAYMSDPQNKGKTLGDAADALANSGNISQQGLVAAKKADVEQRTAVATLDDKQLANAKAAHAQTQELYNNVMNLPDDQLAANWPSIAQQYDAIPGNQKIPLNPNQPLTKDQLKQFGPLVSMQESYLSAEQEKRKTRAATDKDAAQAGEATAATLKSQAETNYYAQNGGAPGVPIEVQQQNDWLAKHPGKGPADFAVAQAGAKAGAEERARMPGEMALAAQRQALSQGDPGSAAQLLVNGDATLSELKARGATPDFIARTLFAANKLSGGKYNAQSADAQFKVAQSPTNVAFFGSAKSLTDKGGTLDQLSEAAKDIPQGQIPAFNSIADWEKAASGSGPIAKYASIALGVADDYSKVVGGGQGSDASRAQALHLIGANQSPEQRVGSIGGIRGTVNSQMTSRIGKNQVLQRMYGDTVQMDSAAPTSAPPPKALSVGQVITQGGHQYKVTAVDKNGKPTAADPL